MRSIFPGALLSLVMLTAPAIGEGATPGPPTVEDIRALYLAERATWEPAPKVIVDAFVVAEDKTFFQRKASGSTITRSVARRFMPPEARGITASAFSILVARALSHDEIIDWYVNSIYLGLGCEGVDEAAMAYFGKTPEALELGEYAYLARLPKAPLQFDPVESYDRAVSARNFVLNELVQADLVSDDAAEAAKSSELVVLNPLGACAKD